MKRFSTVLVLSLVACSGEQLDVGSDDSNLQNQGSGGTGATGGTGGTGNPAQQAAAVAPIPNWATVGSCPTTGEPAPQFVGTWEGAVEDFYLNPITPLRLEITQATSDGVCGTLSWGAGKTPPLPLTDPAQDGQAFGFGGSTGFPVEGLDYTIVVGAARDATLRFSISGREPWKDYCAMQQDLYYHPGAQVYQCMEAYSQLAIPQSGDECVLSTSHGAVTLPLKQCAACDYSVCKCNADTCAASPEPTRDFSLTLDRTLDDYDLLRTDDDSIGAQAIHLERVE